MAIAKIDCFAGASGDMFLGAWLDVGISEDAWLAGVRPLLEGQGEIEIARAIKQEIAATRVLIRHKEGHVHRHLADVEAIIDAADLPDVVKRKAKDAFFHLAVAEASIHGTTPDAIHFHEVGAIDAIVDIVGAMWAWHLAGEPDCYVSPIEVGGGSAICAHGRVPVPAPATLALLKGFPIYSSGLWGETTTPTGAAIIRVLAKAMPVRPMRVDAIGYGAGTKDLPVANVLRISLGEWVGAGPDASEALHRPESHGGHAHHHHHHHHPHEEANGGHHTEHHPSHAGEGTTI
ncbi:LarC family nickel insertion protein [Alicyclobacillus sendaiensis]|uniref:LarC family nickel insertion protein n=1 Tax=Alicyclobacillus sendaiensis PA2 TaxID=3029425 RepID=A0ABT6XUF3_ALISE|nr:LarC family nickel insertion protein [Alicyclobacillus sendaiensis]MDI9258711.1 LarC family nickel insertion protein [Alicyclobacillus sendaiensis PA2]